MKRKTPAPPLVVIDTSLVLSSLVFAQGRLASLRQAWQSKNCRPMVSAVTTQELLRVLAYPKFRLSDTEQTELVADYLPYCSAVRMPIKPPVTIKCRDCFDLPFLQLAMVGKAQYLVTGDKDLLVLNGQFVCPIIPADLFLTVLKI